MFPLLDSVSDNGVTKAALHEEHVADEKDFGLLQAAIDSGDLERIKGLWVSYSASHLAHLAHEEEVMMPLVGKLGGGDPQKRALIFRQSIIAAGLATGVFVSFVCSLMRP